MPRKKTAESSKKLPAKHASQARFGDMHQADLLAKCIQLSGFAAAIEGLATKMKERGYESVRMDGVTQLDAAITKAKHFHRNLSTALVEKVTGDEIAASVTQAEP